MHFNAILLGLAGLVPTALAAKPPSSFFLQAKSIQGGSTQFNNWYMTTVSVGGPLHNGRELPVFSKQSGSGTFYRLADPETNGTGTFYTMISQEDYGTSSIALMAYDTAHFVYWEPVEFSPTSNTVPVPSQQKTGFYVTGDNEDDMYLMWTNTPNHPTAGRFQAWLG
jgi:hypothetical protein